MGAESKPDPEPETVFDPDFDKHDIPEADADHARRNAIRRWDLGNGRIMAIGPTLAGNLIEVAYRRLPDGNVYIFHADNARQKWINP